ncbi:cryptochrome/photolyase family protein [Niveibacterium microcysteis]|uniref:Deoxyribodipyrimidine photo-lyase n=1 Tax=Niveibacterium microcysteis TaxID=2811415 RepID=A0ABX7M5S5_9RHOO|nr:deoxyribodipyrimidine photo-lyase [Niveibacterium microcysteis]QSI76784.1 deoxyribodipyrimidine photo-lyase [Niveibacterium microcysteis]
MSIALVWFRRDLRDNDHAALYHALKAHTQVYCSFVFDREILDALPCRQDRRVEFIHASVVELDTALRARGGGLIVLHGSAREALPALALQLGASAVYANHDYEPAALARDDAVRGALGAAGVAFHTFKDQVIFEKSEVLTGAGRPFSVFTPYRNAWRRQLTPFFLQAYPVERYAAKLRAPKDDRRIPSLVELGFEPSNLAQLAMPCGMSGARALWQDFRSRMGDYDRARDFPAVKGVSYLSTHLRFGTISIRELARAAFDTPGKGAETWLNELIWRDFYQQVLWHRPDVVARSFRPEFDAVRWEEGPDAERMFEAWCEARTGYPLVDAAMRQLNQTGWMHNRLRMVVASFLTKDLGIHWLRGERYFAEKLNDYDLAANNGGWQWAASTGCDAQPWFRIFNPVTQSERFDPDGRFIRRYLPELADVPTRWIHAPWLMSPLEQAAHACVIGRDYPPPLVDHAQARERTLQRFKLVKTSETD